MNRTAITIRTSALAAAAGLALVAFSGPAASGTNGPDRRARAGEYPLLVIVFETEPKRPKAGEPFLALAGIVNEETGLPLESGQVRCRATIGRRGVRVGFKQLETGIAACGWTIPAGTGGKRLRGRIIVTSDEGDVSVPFKKVIRR